MFNWEKVNRLTSYTYPTITEIPLTDNLNSGTGRYANPPIIDFRIGDIYKKKIGIIDSLSYTFPDNGGWETDPTIGLLPKFIEVSISIKFIENANLAEEGGPQFYNYELSAESLKALNEQNGSSDFNSDPVENNGKRNETSVNKLDKHGSTVNFNRPTSSPLNLNKTKAPTPVQSHENSQPNVFTEPNIKNEQVSSPIQLSPIQQKSWDNVLKQQGFKIETNTTEWNLESGEVLFSHKKQGYIVMDVDGVQLTSSPPSLANGIDTTSLNNIQI